MKISTTAAAMLVPAALLLAACATTGETTPHATNATLTTEYNQRLAKRVPMKVFSPQDSVVSLVDFQWADVSHDAGSHLVEWRWYKDDVLVSQTQKRLDFKSTPFTTWTRRAAASLGPGHFRVDTALDGQVASSSEFDIKP
jgi:hypothetical protein